MDVVQKIKQQIAAGTLEGKDLPAVLDAIVEIVNTNKDTKELIQDMAEEGDDLYINFIIPAVGDRCLSIEKGVASHLPTKHGNPTVTITTDADTAVAILSGKAEAMAMYSAKKLSLEGNIAKAAALILVLQVVADEFGIEFKR
ncbi:MAG: alkyl sulfatase C-terminal domain-containing protein [Candidatus Sigynarchaeota archaeon]